MKTVFKLTRMSAPLLLWDYRLSALKICMPSWRRCPLSEKKEVNTQDSQRCKRQRERPYVRKHLHRVTHSTSNFTPVERACDNLFLSHSWLQHHLRNAGITADALHASLTLITTHSHAPILYSVTWHQTDIYLGDYKHNTVLLTKPNSLKYS